MAHELRSTSGLDEMAERAASRVDALKRRDDFRQMRVVGVRDPAIKLPLRLPEDAGERVGILPLNGGIWDQRGQRRKGGETVRTFAGSKRIWVLTSRRFCRSASIVRESDREERAPNVVRELPVQRVVSVSPPVRCPTIHPFGRWRRAIRGRCSKRCREPRCLVLSFSLLR